MIQIHTLKYQVPVLTAEKAPAKLQFPLQADTNINKFQFIYVQRVIHCDKHIDVHPIP
jgi:hypothetical protein